MKTKIIIKRPDLKHRQIKHKTLRMLKQSLESVALLCSLTSVGFAPPETLLVLDLTGVFPPNSLNEYCELYCVL